MNRPTRELKPHEIVRVAKDTWPVEEIFNRPVINFFRKLLLTKKKMTYAEYLKIYPNRYIKKTLKK